VVQREKIGAVLVVGGGVSGMRAAIDLADAGMKAYLIESLPSVGGVVAQLGFMFPTHDCVLCRGTSDHGYGCTRPSITPWLLDFSPHPFVELMTLTEVVSVSGQPGHFVVTVRHKPRYVEAQRCINCNRCAQVCPVELPDSFQMGLSTRKAAYKVAVRAVPNAYVIERGEYCVDCRQCVSVCPTGAIDLEEQEWYQEIHVGAIILTVGYKMHDPTANVEYGYGRYPNVITSLEYERLASRSGPLEGLVRRPSDGKLPRRIAWVQCVGSRDQEHPYCSSICCMYATKEAVLAKQRLPGVDTQIFLMDERSFSKAYSAYTRRAVDMFGVGFIRSRVSMVYQDSRSLDLIIRHQTEDGILREERFDMVVLSVGSQPPAQSEHLAEMLGIELDEYGFCRTEKFEPVDTTRAGVYVAGAFSMPKEITESIIDASGAVAQAIQLLSGTQSSPVDVDGDVERDVSSEPPQVGVFVCRCGGEISDVIDLSDALAYARTLPGVVYAGEVALGCQEEGLDEIEQILRENGINRLVVGACTARSHEPLFQGLLRRVQLNPYLLEFVSLRESCSWVHYHDPAGATRKAKELLRFGVARVRQLEPIERLEIDYDRRALVLGGGVAGLTAALTIAEQGYDVFLVEKEEKLGGNVRNLHFTVEGDNPRQMLRNLIRRVESHERIAVLKGTELIRFQGTKGRFTSTLYGMRNNSNGTTGQWDVTHGVCIVATGANEFRGPVYSLNQDERVVTQLELEAMIAQRPADINELESVAMIQCVGPWSCDPSQDFYCSRTCCTNTMKNAIRIKVINPSCQVVVLYKELMTYGFRERYYTEARERGVLFIRYKDDTQPEVHAGGNSLRITVQDLALDQEIVLLPDLLALSMASVPSEGTAKLADMLGVPLSPEGFFMEDNLKLRPMDFTREGIFLCGAAHYPKFCEEAIAHALATSARAMTILGHEKLEATVKFAQVDQGKCVGCLTCTRTCPFHIPKIDPKAVGVGGILGAAYIEPVLCTGCGTCTSECPANAIQLLHYRDNQIMVPDMPVLGQWLVVGSGVDR
jgi:heterodisulfide reductase subunit A